MAIDPSTFNNDQKNTVMRNFTGLGWRNDSSYGITAGGAQFCQIDGLTEVATAPTDRLTQLCWHWAHSVVAHPTQLFQCATLNSTTAATAG